LKPSPSAGKASSGPGGAAEAVMAARSSSRGGIQPHHGPTSPGQGAEGVESLRVDGGAGVDRDHRLAVAHAQPAHAETATRHDDRPVDVQEIDLDRHQAGALGHVARLHPGVLADRRLGHRLPVHDEAGSLGAHASERAQRHGELDRLTDRAQPVPRRPDPEVTEGRRALPAIE
jgi:hypothetical protein